MPEETTDEPKYPPEFDKMKAVLDQLKGEVKSWEGDKTYNLHLLRSDQLKTKEWADFCKVFLFPLYPKDAIRNLFKFLDKTGNLGPLASFYDNLPGLNVKVFDLLQEEEGANAAVDRMLRSPHLGEIVREKVQMLEVMSPTVALHGILEGFRAKHWDIGRLQDSFYRWLIFISYYIFNDFFFFPKGHLSKADLDKENVNLIDEATEEKRKLIHYRRQLGVIERSMPYDPDFIPKELERIDPLIETWNRQIGRLEEAASSREPGKPPNVRLYALLSSISLSLGGNLSSCKNEVVHLVYYLFPHAGQSNEKFFSSFEKFKSSPFGQQIISDLMHLYPFPGPFSRVGSAATRPLCPSSETRP